MSAKKLKSWAALKAGDIVDVVAPGFPTTAENLQLAVEFLKNLGLKPRVPADLMGPDIVCSNSDDKRLEQLSRAFLAKDSKAVWCVRGGYGAIRIIEKFSKIKKPKINKLFIGYSDAVTIHNFLNQFWSFSSLHGPLLDRLGQNNLPADQIEEMKAVVLGQKKEIEFKKLNPLNKLARTKKTIQSVVVGGNLTVTSTHLGTKFSRTPKGQILFFEDTGERGYRVDRVLKHLEMAGYFKGVVAIIFGEFIGGQETDGSSKISAVLERFAQNIKIPVFSGLEVGHGQNQRPLPLGVSAQLECGEHGRLTIKISSGSK